MIKIPEKPHCQSVCSPHCTKCGKSVFVSTLPISLEKMIYILTESGWKFPEGICDGCACPMEWWERHKIKELKEPLLGIFYQQMRGKYGDAVDFYFPESARQ